MAEKNIFSSWIILLHFINEKMPHGVSVFYKREENRWNINGTLFDHNIRPKFTKIPPTPGCYVVSNTPWVFAKPKDDDDDDGS